jgi:transposase-like protein
MNKNDQNRVVAWRLKLLRQAGDMPRSVAQTCRHFGLSRKAFYKWRASTKVTVRPAYPTDRESRSTFRRQRPCGDLQDPVPTGSLSLWPRQDPASYLQRSHHLTVARSTVHRILIRYGMDRLPANQKRRPTGRPGSGK